ncbi:MAG: hypothetical protein KDA86_12015 [Planctomycetaceae bacterium]|nr:hypothetical protein [Planctomycetaceae bacterium]
MSERLIRQWAAGFSNLHTGFAFDPNAGTVVVEPTAQGKGYWVGAPSVTQDPRDGAIYLVYRVRRPRGVEPDRGAEIHIVRSLDGKSFEHVWTGYKDTLNTTSIERCALVPQDDGTWVLYPSYVDPADGRWRTDRLTAATPSEFDFADVEPVLTAADTATEGVKDPFVFQVAGLWHMIVSYATQEGNASAESMHGTNDAYNTGLIKSRTGLATSEDGRHWIWEGEIFGPSADGWDCYCSRIGTVWREDGIWLGLYDGSASVEENYEERVGLAYSHDLRHWHRVTRSGPLMHQPHASGALRYFDVLELDDRKLVYYETARADGSHDLRTHEVPT